MQQELFSLGESSCIHTQLFQYQISEVLAELPHCCENQSKIQYIHIYIYYRILPPIPIIPAVRKDFALIAKCGIGRNCAAVAEHPSRGYLQPRHACGDVNKPLLWVVLVKEHCNKLNF